jgi:UrcA family protein
MARRFHKRLVIFRTRRDRCADRRHLHFHRGRSPFAAPIDERISTMKYRLIPALVAGYLAWAPMAVQASDTTATVRVDMRALDLSAPADVKTAERRIARAVRLACRSDVEHLSFKARRVARQCREAMRELALRKLQGRQLQQLAAQ